jgi:two-component system, NtrC family, sensor kinase
VNFSATHRLARGRAHPQPAAPPPGAARWRLADLSWRLKIPLLLTAVILLTEFVVTTALVVRTLRDARTDLEASASSLTNVLARSLRGPMLRDDLWQAFEVVRTPLAARTSDNPLQGVIVLDAEQRVFVASDPRRFPVMTAAADLPASLAGLARRSWAMDAVVFLDQRTFTRPGELGAAGPVRAEDGTRLGTVLLDYDADRHAQRLRATLWELALVSLPGLLLLIPLGWIAGKRLAEPLVQTARALSRVGHESPDRIAAALPADGPDEVGQLSAQARAMLAGLARKEALEREMVASERLAAVGRVSAAIAHEINNPLGGMLNAIDTASRHGRADALTRKSLGLLQRGLLQIRSTVGALLVEARLDTPQLAAQDWDDLRMLIAPQVESRRIELGWDVDAGALEVALPSQHVRQLALNLLLNAAKAAEPTAAQGRAKVRLAALRKGGDLVVSVANTGSAIAPEQRSHLFEPFIPAAGQDGLRSYGLGLWVCWQIVQRLQGSVGVECEDGWTTVTVVLPLPGAAPARHPSNREEDRAHGAPVPDRG